MRDGHQFARRLGDLLVSQGLLTPDQLARAIAEQVRTEERLSTILVRLDLVDEDDLMTFLSREYKLPVVELPDVLPADIAKLVPASVARKHEVLAVNRTTAGLTVAIGDPTNLSALDDVSFRTGLRVVPVLARPSALRRYMTQTYPSPRESLADALTLAEAEAERIERSLGRGLDHDLRVSADQAPIVRLVNAVLEEAVRRGASDVHLDPAEPALRIRLRTDGILAEVMAAPKRIESAVISRVKIMANLDIAERRLPQDGRIKFRYVERDVDFRVSVLPTIFGESLALRVLDKDALKLDPGMLGFDDWGLQQFEKAIQSPHGVILITGPTGSGKTTTLYSAIQALNSPDRHIVTLEDPVEYNLAGVNQVQVREEIGLTFATALRAFLRHDPNVILVGEMRDTDTAQMAVRAALTGHLVLSTLHTNDCASTIARLVDMGLAPFLLASALRLVVAQRLVRKVCSECAEPHDVDEEELAAYGVPPRGVGHAVLYAGKGCAVCSFTGTRGRVAIYEVMAITPEICELIMANAPAGDIRRVAREQGMRTLREAGLARAIDGVTTLDEVARVTAE